MGLAVLVRYKLSRPIVYKHSLGGVFKKNGHTSTHPFRKIFFIARLVVLLLLAFLIAKPQLVDSNSKVPIDGLDIILVLDLSGSMHRQDNSNDQRARVEIAKAEAIRFIDKRTSDAIGLVIFAQDAVSRCPITHDKLLLKDIINKLDIGTIDPDGTRLAVALITAANRLRAAQAKSKIMILLTDGEPSEGDMNPDTATEIAQKMGIKIYTIGIGSEKPVIIRHPMHGLIQLPGINKNLLENIAKKTGGQAFMAHNAQDMRAIYDTIDQLEKTEHDTPVFTNFYDIFMPIVMIVIGVVMSELWLSTFAWFSI